METHNIPPGFYWVDTTSEDYLEAWPQLRVYLHDDGTPAVKVRRTQETDHDGQRLTWALFEVEGSTIAVPEELLLLTGPWTKAPKGRQTRMQDVMQAPVIPHWTESVPTPETVADNVAKGAGAGIALGIVGLGLFWAVSRGKR